MDYVLHALALPAEIAVIWYLFDVYDRRVELVRAFRLHWSI